MMATFNGMKWIEEQVDSILNQEGVSVRLVVSDDNSTDGTYEWLIKRAEQEQRISLLPKLANIQLGAAGNFYHLLRSVDNSPNNFYALSDQDDIWYSTKLYEQTQILSDKQLSAVSSNIDSFWSDGRSHLIKKSQPQQQFDFFFESAGPGCSYCFNHEVLALVKQNLEKFENVDLPILHDWFIYALCRVNGYKWHIDPKPQLAYRQHHGNEIGAHSGWSASFKRFGIVFSGFYREEVSKLATIFKNNPREDIEQLCERLLRMRFTDRLYLIMHFNKLRRKRSDSLFLALMIASHIF